MDTPAELSTLTYEKALAELDQLIKRLETGSIDLADSIACYERGAALAGHCSALLEATERKVERLIMGPGGQPALQPFAPEAEDGDA